MATKSKVDYGLIALRVFASLLIFAGLVVLLQSIINFKDAQYFVTDLFPRRFSAPFVRNVTEYMGNWVFSGRGEEHDEGFEEVYGCKPFPAEAEDLLRELQPLKQLDFGETAEEDEITQALVARRVIRYLNKGYRFFIVRGEDIIYRDNDLIPRPLKDLNTVADLKEITPAKQRMSDEAFRAPGDELSIYVTVADYYYADFNLGLLMIFCALIGFILCMAGINILERFAGRKIIGEYKRIRYFNKNFVQMILAVFLVSSFNITALVQYVWNQNRLTDFFESGGALSAVYTGTLVYVITALWTITKVGSGFNIAEQNAELLRQTKTDLISNVTHDIATPLTSIIGYVQLLEGDESLSEDALSYVKALKNKAYRLKRIISDLFDLSKYSTGIGLETEKIDMAELLKQTLAEMQDEIESSGHRISAAYPPGPLCINADGNKMYRVFQNLIDNALKYTMPDTAIKILLTSTGKKAVFTIENTASYQMHFNEDEVLERFVRGDKSRTEEGSGLGLSIAETFTRACGGDLKVNIDGDIFRVTVVFKRV